jgi:hypothetical protein
MTTYAVIQICEYGGLDRLVTSPVEHGEIIQSDLYFLGLRRSSNIQFADIDGHGVPFCDASFLTNACAKGVPDGTARHCPRFDPHKPQSETN